MTIEHAIEQIRSNLGQPNELGIILRELVESSLPSHINDLLRSIVTGSEQHLGHITSRSLLLHRSNDFILHMKKIGGTDYVSERSGADQYMFTPGSFSTYLIKSKKPVQIADYIIVQDGDGSAHLNRRGVRYHEGEILFESPDDPFVRDIVPTDEAWIIKIAQAPYATESRYFDRNTLKEAFSGAVVAEASSLVTLCTVFGATSDPAALPYLRTMAGDIAHFVRWAAIQAMARIDPNSAVDALRSALIDVHPAIRTAAARGLQKMAA